LPKRKRATTEKLWPVQGGFPEGEPDAVGRSKRTNGEAIGGREMDRGGDGEVLYGKSIESSAEIARKGRGEGGDESRRKVWAEYREFLSKNAYGISLETATAEDVLAFIQGYWIPKHVEAC
jgi:hypothetical protein